MSTLAELKDKFKDGAKPSGADFADLINHTESNTVINGKADTSALANYATKSDLAGKADVSTLSNYATKNDLSGKADKSELTAYAKTSDLASYAKTTDIPDVSGLQSKPSATLEELPTDEYGDPSNIGITTDTFVDLGTLTADVDLDVNDSKYELAIAFATGDTPHSIIPNAGYYASNTTIEANKSYLFSVCRNVIVVVETTEIE